MAGGRRLLGLVLIEDALGAVHLARHVVWFQDDARAVARILFAVHQRRATAWTKISGTTPDDPRPLPVIGGRIVLIAL